MKMNTDKKLYCINCGKSAETLYKRFNSAVLKLSQCRFCKNVADKYIEYDIIIVFIDLILLRLVAFRHILLNSEFKNFWKLFILILLLESYSEWTITSSYKARSFNKTEPYLVEDNINIEDLKFYKNCLIQAASSIAILTAIFILTKIYELFRSTSRKVSFITIWKMFTLSNCSLLLLLPSLIWDLNILEYHMQFVHVYSTLTQLIAYKAVCDCSDFWTLAVIFITFFHKHYLLLALESLKDYPLDYIIINK